MKIRFRTERQILARIEEARHRRDKQQVLAWNLHEQAVKFWKLSDSEQNEEYRSHGNTLEMQSKTAARALSRYDTLVLPKLGKKLSEFRTRLLRLDGIRNQDHSIPI